MSMDVCTVCMIRVYGLYGRMAEERKPGYHGASRVFQETRKKKRVGRVRVTQEMRNMFQMIKIVEILGKRDETNTSKLTQIKIVEGGWAAVEVEKEDDEGGCEDGNYILIPFKSLHVSNFMLPSSILYIK